jgi:hypothetical protein
MGSAPCSAYACWWSSGLVSKQDSQVVGVVATSRGRGGRWLLIALLAVDQVLVNAADDVLGVLF